MWYSCLVNILELTGFIFLRRSLFAYDSGRFFFFGPQFLRYTVSSNVQGIKFYIFFMVYLFFTVLSVVFLFYQAEWPNPLEFFFHLWTHDIPSVKSWPPLRVREQMLQCCYYSIFVSIVSEKSKCLIFSR